MQQQSIIIFVDSNSSRCYIKTLRLVLIFCFPFMQFCWSLGREAQNRFLVWGSPAGITRSARQVRSVQNVLTPVCKKGRPVQEFGCTDLTLNFIIQIDRFWINQIWVVNITNVGFINLWYSLKFGIFRFWIPCKIVYIMGWREGLFIVEIRAQIHV